MSGLSPGRFLSARRAVYLLMRERADRGLCCYDINSAHGPGAARSHPSLCGLPGQHSKAQLSKYPGKPRADLPSVVREPEPHPAQPDTSRSTRRLESPREPVAYP